MTLIGALSGKDESITKIGTLLVKIPIEPFLSRAIVEGLIYENIIFNANYKDSLIKLSLN